MALELLAYSPEDGWAFVRDADHVQLVRPPYKLSQTTQVEEEDVRRAIVSQGFTTPQTTSSSFSGWSTLESFLESELISARRASNTLPEADVADRLLAALPEEDVHIVLDQIADELIATKRWSEAEKMLRAVSRLPVVTKQPELAQKALGLYEQIIEGKTVRETKDVSDVKLLEDAARESVMFSAMLGGAEAPSANQVAPMTFPAVNVATMEDRCQIVQRMASEAAIRQPDWVAFFREVLGADGIVRKMFPSTEDLTAFEKTTEYAAIQQMVVKLREKGPAEEDSTEPTRMITVCLPKSLHEALKAEAHLYQTSMNDLCISKLVQLVDKDFVLGE